MVKWLAASIFFLGSITVLGQISLNTMMSQEEMRKTGVNRLNYSQKRALENWINENFEIKNSQKSDEQLFLSLNIDEGAKLELSDGKTYEVAPEDRIYSSLWITPFPIMLSASGDRDYPVKMTNMNTNTSVKAKEVSTREAIEGKTTPNRMQKKSNP